MLTPETVRSLADRLEAAETERRHIHQFSLEFPEITIDDAYAVQRAWMDLKKSSGRSVIGHKIGLTSKAMQYAIHINEPDYGFLLDTMLFQDGAEIPEGRFIAAKVEVELAFILGKDLSGPDCTIFDVLRATEYISPAMEILDARIQRVDPVTKSNRTIKDNIADNASDAGIVLGGRPFKPTDPVDLRWVSALCYRNSSLEESGVSAAVLNHPANGVAWLANKLAPFGETLKAGEIILSGSFIRPVDVKSGHTIFADYGPLGTVTCHFA
ncbi:MAG: 2-oxo-hepta-3-ene-1,7-dioic acid hydratase [Desulfovibrio sp.]|jgi:2-oxo-hept-3-ene-1,7-dioate hydratase|nr:2-oxo-hepta-3-ene-1,7-dioic acid hydratase [Desulfovibrio sp.]